MSTRTISSYQISLGAPQGTISASRPTTPGDNECCPNTAGSNLHHSAAWWRHHRCYNTDFCYIFMAWKKKYVIGQIIIYKHETICIWPSYYFRSNATTTCCRKVEKGRIVVERARWRKFVITILAFVFFVKAKRSFLFVCCPFQFSCHKLSNSAELYRFNFFFEMKSLWNRI